MIRFRMFGIHLDQFAILAQNNKDSEMGMKIELGYKYAEEGKKIACMSNFEFGNQQEKLLILSVTCEFEIPDEDWEKLQQNGKTTISKELLEFFAVHTIGTARGVLFCKTENTTFNNIIIPPINVAELINGDLVIE